MSLRLVFMGTPDFAVPSLSEIIASGHEVIRVYTQPPRRAGRGKTLRKTPVHEFAAGLGLDVHMPDSFRKSRVINGLEELKPDVACVVAYGQILPKRALAAPRFGCLNLHGSKLPRWRGAAPIQRAIMAGDTETAVQIMQMEKGLDTGPVLLSETIKISDTDTAASLHDKMVKTGASLWPRALAALERGDLIARPQSGKPSYARKIEKSEARIDWSRPARELDWHIRALSPFPGAWCEIPKKTSKQGLAGKGLERVKILLARPQSGAGKPGVLLDDKLLVACGDGALRILRLQPEGKKPMSAEEFLRGRNLPKGLQLQ